MRKQLVVLLAMIMFTLFIVACTRSTTTGTSSPSSQAAATSVSQPDVVHMSDAQFAQKQITIKKGDHLTLIDDSSAFHVIANGSWQSDGTPKYQRESGAPHIQMQFNGNDSHTVGPFAVVGTYHLYCTVHQDMDLTVIVQ